MEESVLLSDDTDTDVITRKQGSPAYISPEVLNCKEAGYSGKAADVWAMGVILYTLLHGRYPFQDTHINRLFSKIQRGTYILSHNLSSPCRALLKSLLSFDPTKRPSAEQVLQHPWFVVRHVNVPTPTPVVRLQATKPPGDQVVPE